ncbi:MAG TPA: flagellar type III secretion system pore protein FliP [Candidatus Eremiobacteraceae bacterium]|jgi:flagellar biosynthetic protein FliP
MSALAVAAAHQALSGAASPQAGTPVDLLIGFFVLSAVPLLAVAATSFTRIIVVLGLLRAALGAPSLPPNAVLAALAIMLTAAIMSPTLQRIDDDAVRPYLAHHLTPAQAIARGAEPLRAFMLRQARPADVAAFTRMAHEKDSAPAQASFLVVAPAFLVGELRAAFAMGFALALPFAVVDMVTAAVLMSLGMFMVSPATLSLPVKLLLFVVADGWTLVAGALAASFR